MSQDPNTSATMLQRMPISRHHRWIDQLADIQFMVFSSSCTLADRFSSSASNHLVILMAHCTITLWVDQVESSILIFKSKWVLTFVCWWRRLVKRIYLPYGKGGM